MDVKLQQFSAKEYLLMDIAANYGFDKKEWDFRLNWAYEHELNILKEVNRMEENPSYKSDYLSEADDPAMMFAGMLAYRDSVLGKPTGYAISLDATASGIQLLSVMSGCKKSASICNVIPTSETSDTRKDAYTHLYKHMQSIIPPEKCVNITRAMAKDGFMTAYYGSKAMPYKYFNASGTLDQFYETVETQTPGAWNLNLYLQKLWNSYAKQHSWVLPNNFHVNIKEMTHVKKTVLFAGKPVEVTVKENVGAESGLSLCPNITHSLDGFVLSEVCLMSSYTKEGVLNSYMRTPHMSMFPQIEEHIEMVNILMEHYNQSGILSARILPYLAKGASKKQFWSAPVQELLDALPRKTFDIMTAHDCFRVLPTYGNAVRKLYNFTLYRLAKSDILQFIVNQVAVKPQTIRKGDLNPEDILHSNYSIC